MQIRPCRPEERPDMLAIINAAATAYAGIIPDDCYHTPYMSADELDREIAAGVTFHATDVDGSLAAIMGIQHIQHVALIRHAYTAPAHQSRGHGTTLLRHFIQSNTRPLYVGTWQAAIWAIRFYERHGFTLANPEEKTTLLQTYWTVSPRQIETSVVLRKANL